MVVRTTEYAQITIIFWGAIPPQEKLFFWNNKAYYCLKRVKAAACSV